MQPKVKTHQLPSRAQIANIKPTKMDKAKERLFYSHNLKIEMIQDMQSVQAQLAILIPEFEKLKGRMNISEAKVTSLEEENKDLKQKLGVALAALENHGQKIADTQSEVESKSSNHASLEFHHKMLESQETLVNQKLGHTLFIRTSNHANTKNPKKHLLGTIENVLGTTGIEVAKKSIENVHLINGRSNYLRVKIKPKNNPDFLNLMTNHQELLEKNGMFAQRNLIRTTRTKNIVLGKIAQKLKSQFGKNSAQLSKFEFESCLYSNVSQPSIAGFQKLSYHEAINQFGYLLEGEVQFCSKMYWLLGKSKSKMQKKATLLF